MHINAHRARFAHRAGFVLGVLIVVQYGELRGTAQGLPSVRVMTAEAQVFARPDVASDVVTVTHGGAVLDVVDKQDGWYWVLSGRDQNGSRQLGWIQANQVASATAPASPGPLRTLHEELGALPPPDPQTLEVQKAEREKARQAAEEARVAAHEARTAARNEARAAARIEEAARNVEEARRKYEGLTQEPE